MFPVSDSSTTTAIGWTFNCFMGVNISVHLYFMFRSSFRDAKAKCKKRKEKKANQKRIDKDLNQKIGDRSIQVDAEQKQPRKRRRKHMGQSMMTQINEVDEKAESDSETGKNKQANESVELVNLN